MHFFMCLRTQTRIKLIGYILSWLAGFNAIDWTCSKNDLWCNFNLMSSFTENLHRFLRKRPPPRLHQSSLLLQKLLTAKASALRHQYLLLLQVGSLIVLPSWLLYKDTNTFTLEDSFSCRGVYFRALFSNHLMCVFRKGPYPEFPSHTSEDHYSIWAPHHKFTKYSG